MAPAESPSIPSRCRSLKIEGKSAGCITTPCRRTRADMQGLAVCGYVGRLPARSRPAPRCRPSFHFPHAPGARSVRSCAPRAWTHDATRLTARGALAPSGLLRSPVPVDGRRFVWCRGAARSRPTPLRPHLVMRGPRIKSGGVPRISLSRARHALGKHVDARIPGSSPGKCGHDDAREFAGRKSAPSRKWDSEEP